MKMPKPKASKKGYRTPFTGAVMKGRSSGGGRGSSRGGRGR